MEDVPQNPSIKGSLFRYHIEHLLKHVSAGEISRGELLRRLELDDAAILDAPILATEWYDIRLYERVVLLRQALDGDCSNDCLRRYGAEAAERLLQAGLYQQINVYLDRARAADRSDAHARFVMFGRDMRLVVSLSASLFNFSRYEVKVDPDWSDRYVVEISDAAAYPEVLCWTTEGFLNGIATQRGEADLWRWERPEPDRLLYRMTRPL